MIHTVYIADEIDVRQIPTRPYDFNKGDERKSSHDEALKRAEERATETGVRQSVRRDPGAPHFHPLYLIQAFGS